MLQLKIKLVWIDAVTRWTNVMKVVITMMKHHTIVMSIAMIQCADASRVVVVLNVVNIDGNIWNKRNGMMLVDFATEAFSAKHLEGSAAKVK